MPRRHMWGQYKDDVPEIPGMLERAGKDFEFMRRVTLEMLTDPAKMTEAKDATKMYKDLLYNDPEHGIEKERLAMGSWIADYLDDAGYESWFENLALLIIHWMPPIH